MIIGDYTTKVERCTSVCLEYWTEGFIRPEVLP